MCEVGAWECPGAPCHIVLLPFVPDEDNYANVFESIVRGVVS